MLLLTVGPELLCCLLHLVLLQPGVGVHVEALADVLPGLHVGQVHGEKRVQEGGRDSRGMKSVCPGKETGVELRGPLWRLGRGGWSKNQHAAAKMTYFCLSFFLSFSSSAVDSRLWDGMGWDGMGKGKIVRWLFFLPSFLPFLSFLPSFLRPPSLSRICGQRRRRCC